MELVLSLFPGIDLLGRAFRLVGHSVVLGPDLLWDARIEDFHVPSQRFDGVIGGPPCVNYSDANRNRDEAEGDRLVTEFARLIDEAQPEWWLMENVRNVPDLVVPGWVTQRLDVRDWEFGGRQCRLRHLQFGHREGWIIRPLRTISRRPVTAAKVVMTQARTPWDRHCRRCSDQGVQTLPLRAFTPAARRRVIGNAVAWRTALALAAAVSHRGPVTAEDCICRCGRPITPPARHATDACRKRMQRRRLGHARAITYSSSVTHALKS